MKYSNKFEQDFEWYASVSHIFNFDGKNQYYDKKGNNVIVFSENGISAKEAFYFWDSQGKIKATNEPKMLHKIIKTKGSINLHIKMYAEDRAKGLLCRSDIEDIAKEFGAPQWFIDAIERQKTNYPPYSLIA